MPVFIYKSSFASWFWLVLSCLLIGVRCQGVLWFDLCNIPFLILLHGFNTEHAGPSWQKPDQVNCWAIETKEARKNNTWKQRAAETETERFASSWTDLWLPTKLLLTLASNDVFNQGCLNYNCLSSMLEVPLTESLASIITFLWYSERYVVACLEMAGVRPG